MSLYHVKPTSIEAHGDEFHALWDSEGKHTILFVHADWCGHCKNTMPAFRSAATDPSVKSFNFALLSDTELAKMKKPLPVAGFPSFFMIDKDTGLLSAVNFPREKTQMLAFLSRL